MTKTCSSPATRPFWILYGIISSPMPSSSHPQADRSRSPCGGKGSVRLLLSPTAAVVWTLRPYAISSTSSTRLTPPTPPRAMAWASPSPSGSPTCLAAPSLLRACQRRARCSPYGYRKQFSIHKPFFQRFSYLTFSPQQHKSARGTIASGAFALLLLYWNWKGFGFFACDVPA